MQSRDSFQRWVAITPSDTVAIGETTAADGKARAPRRSMSAARGMSSP